jgi:hypothetical protein
VAAWLVEDESTPAKKGYAATHTTSQNQSGTAQGVDESHPGHVAMRHITTYQDTADGHRRLIEPHPHATNNIPAKLANKRPLTQQQTFKAMI